MNRLIIVVSIVLLSACQAIQPAGVSAAEKAAADYFHKYGQVRRFVFSDWAGSDVPVWTFIPDRIDTANAPILFMLHGAKRNPARYLREWQPHAQEHGFVVVAPEFSKDNFPKSAGYNQGNVFRSEGVDLRDESQWSFSAIEPIFDHIVRGLNSNETSYTIYGHSAGSQFVHRFLYYKPNVRAKRFIAANAGWYTLPDFGESYPYGLDGSEVSVSAQRAALGKSVVILLGDEDNNPEHKSMRRTPEALRQGPHRFARGHYFYEAGQQQAESLSVPFGWQLQVVEGVGHSNGGMAAGAAPFVE